jgi:hypothetical protein
MRQQNPGGFGRRDFAMHHILPVAIVIPLPVAMMIVVTVIVVAAYADTDRADMDPDDRGIGSAGHQTKRNNRSK